LRILRVLRRELLSSIGLNVVILEAFIAEAAIRFDGQVSCRRPEVGGDRRFRALGFELVREAEHIAMRRPSLTTLSIDHVA
jgi:hypothetical protein